MTAATSPDDAFARVLDLAQAVLDDPALDADALAGRAHLSRFHFDRVIAAAAGEPPGALRRRLLLERSAYHLLDERYRHRTVLEIAVDAGFASHEAFTRAFARAYGRRPTDLRQATGADRPLTFRDLELPGASRVHFQPPGSLRLPSRSETTGAGLVQQLVDHHVGALGAMLGAVAGLEEPLLDAPITTSVETIDAPAGGSTTLRDLLAAMVTQEEHWLHALRGAAWPDDTDRSVPGMAARHEEAGRDFRAVVAQALADRTLGDTMIDTTCDPPWTHTLGSTIAHVVTFAAVRRILAAGALQTYGVSDADGEVTRWADPRPMLDGLR